MKANGKPPKPTALKILHGTRKDRINPNEPTPDLGVPDMPDDLSETDQTCWHRNAAIIAEQGVLYKTHGGMLKLLVKAEVEFDMLSRKIIDDGVDAMVGRTPAIKLRGEVWTRYLRALQEFGLSPSSMTRVSAIPKVVKADPKAEKAKRMFGK